MAKGAERDIAIRKLYILEELNKHRKVNLSELEGVYQNKFKIKAVQDALGRDIKSLRSQGFLIDRTETELRFSLFGQELLWEGTPVGNRLNIKKDEKQSIAKEVIDQMRELDRIMIGGGTTVYEVAKEILDTPGYMGIRTIYTCNLLVLYECIQRKISVGDLKVGINMGELKIITGTLYSEEGNDYFAELEVDAVITSFYGLREECFYTREDFEVPEKLMNLSPHRNCRHVLIPLEWDRIGHIDEAVVKKSGRGKKSRNVLDFQGGEREYVIITNPPGGKPDSDVERYKILKSWEKRGVKLKYVSEA